MEINWNLNVPEKVRPEIGNSKKRVNKAKHLKWYDKTCAALCKKIRLSKLHNERKDYKKLLKNNHKDYINNLFVQLDSMQNSNPKGYMNLVKSLRDGSFDKQATSDSDFVLPENWHQHFSNLLGPNINPTTEEEDMLSYISDNCDKFASDLERPLTSSELMESIASLKNNKASSFDQITNEIIKASRHYTAKPILLLFDKILDTSIYPSPWQFDILSPLHKAGEKSDPNNFRGISVSSWFGKLFNKMLQKRLEKLCQTKITNECHSGKGEKKGLELLTI